MRFRLLSFFLILFFLVSFATPCFAAEDAIYVWSNQAESISKQTVSTNANLTASTTDLSLDCSSAILMEQTTGQILYASHEHDQLRPASVTKLMSLLLIMEALEKGTISLDSQIPCS